MTEPLTPTGRLLLNVWQEHNHYVHGRTDPELPEQFAQIAAEARTAALRDARVDDGQMEVPYIRGYNAGFDDAWEQQTEEVRRLREELAGPNDGCDWDVGASLAIVRCNRPATDIRRVGGTFWNVCEEHRDPALAASQPSASAAQGPGMPDRRALSSAIGATFGDYAGNDIPWPPTQEFSDRVMARLQGLAAIGRYAAAARPDPDPAGAPE